MIKKFASLFVFAQVAIGTSSPDGLAKLQIYTTYKGFLAFG